MLLINVYTIIFNQIADNCKEINHIRKKLAKWNNLNSDISYLPLNSTDVKFIKLSVDKIVNEDGVNPDNINYIEGAVMIYSLLNLDLSSITYMMDKITSSYKDSVVTMLSMIQSAKLFLEGKEQKVYLDKLIKLYTINKNKYLTMLSKELQYIHRSANKIKVVVKSKNSRRRFQNMIKEKPKKIEDNNRILKQFSTEKKTLNDELTDIYTTRNASNNTFGCLPVDYNDEDIIVQDEDEDYIEYEIKNNILYNKNNKRTKKPNKKAKLKKDVSERDIINIKKIVPKEEYNYYINEIKHKKRGENVKVAHKSLFQYALSRQDLINKLFLKKNQTYNILEKQGKMICYDKKFGILYRLWEEGYIDKERYETLKYYVLFFGNSKN